MGTNPGNAMASVPGAKVDLSNALGSNLFIKSANGSSSSNFLNIGESTFGITLEKYKLLDDTIDYIIIGIEPFGLGELHSLSDFTGPFRSVLPSHLGGGKFFYHLSCLLGLEKTKEYVILEYGAYFGKEPTYKNYIYYVYDPVEEGGLRFSKMNYDDYLHKIYNGKEGAVVIFGLDIDKKMTLKDLLFECKLYSSWTAKDYNLFTHNCQDFIAKVIEVLKVKRDISNETKYCHIEGKLSYPPVILNALENNDTPTALKIAAKIPIVNWFTELGGRIYKSNSKNN